MKRKLVTKTYFNMIEVALAMAVIAFGMTSILGLFPVGLNALRDSIAENYSSEAIENMMGYIKHDAHYSVSNYDRIFVDVTNSIPVDIDSTTVIPGIVGGYNKVANIDPTSADIGITQKFINWFQNSASNLDGGVGEDFGRVLPGSKLPFFKPKEVAGAPYQFVYFVVKGSDNANSRDMDFSAMIIMKKAIGQTKFASGDPDIPASWNGFSGSYNEFGAIVFEVSWPLEKKYSEREKRYYYMVISRPL